MLSVGKALLPAATWLVAFLLPGDLHAHGGVVAEDDICVINIGYLKAHFKIYVPARTGHRDYCEDIPIRGESLFVMEYEHDSLSESVLDFRIIRNVTGKGIFARVADVDAIGDLDAVTVHHSPPAVVPDVYTVLHDFDEDGEYIGIVEARTPGGGRRYTAVFPFMVGDTGTGVWPWVFAGLFLLQANYWFWNRRRKAAVPATPTLVAWLPAVALLAVSVAHAEPVETQSRNGDYVVRYEPDLDPLLINRIHGWTLDIAYPDGSAVSGATVKADGGMPEHDHGLPTAPEVRQVDADGRYRIEGLRFHMPGAWIVQITIDDGERRDIVNVELRLSR